MECTNCHKQIPDGSKFCNYCGIRVDVTDGRVCSKCGYKNPLDALYCTECGEKLFINNEKKITYNFFYQFAPKTSLYIIEENGYYGILDKSCQKMILPCQYHFIYKYGFCHGEISTISEEKLRLENLNVIGIQKGKKWGLVNRKGVIVNDFIYDKMYNAGDNDLTCVCKEGEYGLINKDGTMIIPCKYRYPFSFHEGLAHVADTHYMHGFIDINGVTVIPFEYLDGKEFEGGLAPVKAFSGRYGYIDKTNKQITDFKYDNADPFNKSFARVMINGRWGMINKKGKEILPCIYDLTFYDWEYNVFCVQNNSKWGVIDVTGKKIRPCIYDKIWDSLEAIKKT